MYTLSKEMKGKKEEKGRIGLFNLFSPLSALIRKGKRKEWVEGRMANAAIRAHLRSLECPREKTHAENALSISFRLVL